MRNKWSRFATAVFCFGIGAILQGDTRFRFLDPITSSTTGTDVDPRTGRLTMGFPMPSVNGPMPIPVVYRFSGSYQEQIVPGTRVMYDPSRGGVYNVPSIDIGMRPAYGSIHFGYISNGSVFGSITEPKTFVLENGLSFREGDFVPLTSFPVPSIFSLASEFKLNNVSSSIVNVTVVASHAWYSASLADLGSWQSAVQNAYPSGFGANPTTFRVVLDRNVARIYAPLGGDARWAPLLWVDRYGHSVSFKWYKFANSYAVEATNHLGKGVQVQWSQTALDQTVLVNYIGINGPSTCIQAMYSSGGRPSGGTWQTDRYMSLSAIPNWDAGPVGRPKSITMGDRSSMPSPSWLSAGRPLPTVPADGTQTAEPMVWNFEWDTAGSELAAMTTPSGVRTSYTYDSNVLSLSDGTYTIRRVTSATATSGGPRTATRSQTWAWGTASGGAPKVNMKNTYGALSGTGETELVYVGDANSIHYGNGITQIARQKDSAGTVISTTTYGLVTAGISGAPYSRANAITVTGRSGEPDHKTTFTTSEYGLQNAVVTESVGSGGTFTEYQRTENSYLTFPDLLNVDTVTSAKRYINGQLVATTTNELTPSRLLPTNVYTTGAGGPTLGTTTSYDSEGRVATVVPYPAANTPWKVSETWTSGAWVKNSSKKQYQNPGDASGAFSGELKGEVTSWDTSDRPLTTKDEKGLITTVTYDLFGRLKTSQTTGLGLIELTYSNNGNTVSQSTTIGLNTQGNPIKVTSTQNRDGFGRLTKSIAAGGGWLEYYYDEQGRCSNVQKFSSMNSIQAASTTSYDPLGRVVSTTSPTGATQTMSYSVSGNNSVVTKSITAASAAYNQILSSKEYRNALGQVVQVVRPDGATSIITYNNLGKVASTTLTPSGGGTAQQRSFSYDGLGRLTSMTHPEVGTISSSGINYLGLPTSIMEASQRTRTFTYDGLGRVRKVVTAGGSESTSQLAYTYTGVDLTSASSLASNGVNIAQNYEYNGPAHQLSKETTEQPGLKAIKNNYYDAYGNLTKTTYPSGRDVDYSYSTLGYVTGIKYNGNNVVSNILVDEWMNPKELDFASQAYSKWTYSYAGIRLNDWSIGYAGNAFSGGVRKYTYDTADRLTQAGEWTLTPDVMSHIQQAGFNSMQTGDSSYTSFHTYDAYGNDTSHTLSGSSPASTIAYTLGAMPTDKMPTAATNGAPTGWSINANGEATSIGTAVGAVPAISFTWDGLGRLANVGSPNANQSYLYDSKGYRVSLIDSTDASRNRKYAYDFAGRLLGECTSSGSWRDVIYLGTRAVAEYDVNGIHELHNDHLGTPRIVTNGATGQIQGRQGFGAYGEVMVNSSSDNIYKPLTGYTGHIQNDATGLIYMKGRYYSPGWHRFISSNFGVDPNSENHFAYANGSPFYATDPSGMDIQIMGFKCDEYGMFNDNGTPRGYCIKGHYELMVSFWDALTSNTPNSLGLRAPDANRIGQPGDTVAVSESTANTPNVAVTGYSIPDQSTGTSSPRQNGGGSGGTPQTNQQTMFSSVYDRGVSPGGVFTFGGSQGKFHFNGVIHEYDFKHGYSNGLLNEAWVGKGLNTGLGKITSVDAPAKGIFGFFGLDLDAILGGVQIGIAGNPMEGDGWTGVYIEGHSGKTAIGAGAYISNPILSVPPMEICPGVRF